MEKPIRDPHSQHRDVARKAQRPKKSGMRLLLALLLAVLIHGFVILPVLSALLNAPDTNSLNSPLQVNLWTDKPTAAQTDTDLPDDGVVIDIPDSKTTPAAQTSRYISQKGSSTQIETRQKNDKTAFRGTPSSPPPFRPMNAQNLPPTPIGTPLQNRPEQSSPLQNTRDEIVIPATPEAIQPSPPARPLLLQPNDNALSTAISESGLSNLDDVVDGQITSVNSAAFRHAAFFTRVQKKVEQFWHPDIAIQRHDPEARIIGTKDRVTTLLVVLSTDGSIHSLHPISPSGVAFLDEEAMSAVKTAGPFPNVPQGLASSSDGLVKFLFQFTVEFNQRPALRIRRYD